MKVKILKLLTILVVLFIWIHSLFPASLSGGESSWWLKECNALSAMLHLPVVFTDEKLLRKLAHVTEYAALGIVGTLYFRAAGKLLKSFGRHHLLYMGLTVAFLDETIQMFVPGRTAEIRDVWIDLAGFLTAMGIVMLCTGRKRKLSDNAAS